MGKERLPLIVGDIANESSVVVTKFWDVLIASLVEIAQSSSSFFEKIF